MSRTYTFQDLQSRTLSELLVLRGALQRDLAASVPGSAACRETLLSLDAVARAIRLWSQSYSPR